MTITMRGQCEVCLQRRRIRRDGMIRVHYTEINYQGVECPGSNRPPLGNDEERNWYCNTGCTGCRDMIDYGV